MKKIPYSLLLMLLVLSCFKAGANSQQTRPPCNVSASIRHYPSTNSFELVNTCPLNAPAFYTYLWWMGDNSFSFLPTPQNQFQQDFYNPNIEIVSIATGNYSTGGPPPVSMAFSDPNFTPDPFKVIPIGNKVYMQNFRNAVVGDTLYLILSYRTDAGATSGDLYLDLPPNTEILTSMMNQPQFKGFLPNSEIQVGNGHWAYSNLDPGFDYSMLVPIKILPSHEASLSFNFRFNTEGDGGSYGMDYYPLEIMVAESHDPNQLIEFSDAENQCDYGGKPIDYTVQFENVGAASTYYVKVVCQLDDKLNLSSINRSNFRLPASFADSIVEGPIPNNNLYGVTQKVTYYTIDTSTQTLTFEFPGMYLLSPLDPNNTNLAFVGDELSFSIDVLPNYVFGEAIKSRATIYFDTNMPIETNVAITQCKEPLSMGNGGGFVKPSPSPSSPKKWYFLVVASVVGLAGAALGLRRRKVI